MDMPNIMIRLVKSTWIYNVSNWKYYKIIGNTKGKRIIGYFMKNAESSAKWMLLEQLILDDEADLWYQNDKIDGKLICRKK